MTWLGMIERTDTKIILRGPLAILTLLFAIFAAVVMITGAAIVLPIIWIAQLGHKLARNLA